MMMLRGSSLYYWELLFPSKLQDDMNVIVYDWSLGADNIQYTQAVANTRVAGALLAKMLKQIHASTHARYSTMHLIGHSLGAHIAGYTGRRIPRLGRITGNCIICFRISTRFKIYTRVSQLVMIKI